jgi:hypothetical protein
MRRFWSWVLACALLAAPTLGAVHGVAHARLASGPAASSKAVATASLGGLFKSHDDGSGCRLFDQLSHGDAVPTAAVAVATLATTDCVLPAEVGVAASSVLPFRARGPPFLA